MTRYQQAGRLVRLIGWLAMLPAAFLAIATVAAMQRHDAPSSVLGSVLFLFLVGLALLYLKVGASVKRHEEWARTGGFITGSLALAVFPVGTLLGAFILYYLSVGWDDEDHPAVS